MDFWLVECRNQSGFPRWKLKFLSQLWKARWRQSLLKSLHSSTYLAQNTVAAMPKRTSDAADEPGAKAAPAGRVPRLAEEDEGMGEFEDKWEDDIESESGGEEEEGMGADGEGDGQEGEDGDVGELKSPFEPWTQLTYQSSHRRKKMKRLMHPHRPKRLICPERSSDQENSSSLTSPSTSPSTLYPTHGHASPLTSSGIISARTVQHSPIPHGSSLGPKLARSQVRARRKMRWSSCV